MAIAAKPVSPTLNEAATYAPDHLWMCNEGSGTTLTDIGKAGTLVNLTLSGPAWATDGTHGAYLAFDKAGSDVATSTGNGEPIFGITTSFTVAVLMRKPSNLAVLEGIAFIYDSAAGNGKFGIQAGAGGYMGWTCHETGGTSEAGTGSAYGSATDNAWRWVSARINTTGIITLNSDGTTDSDNSATFTNASIGDSGTMDSFGLGAILDSGPDNYLTADIAAVAVWANSGHTAGDLLSILNSGDPWAGIGLSTVIKKLKLLVHSDAQSDTGVAGVVFQAPSGGDITGAKIGEFTSKAFESALESGKAVLKVPVADFGGSALTTSDNPVALVRNTSDTTGIVACTVIEE